MICYITVISVLHIQWIKTHWLKKKRMKFCNLQNVDGPGKHYA